MSFKLADVETEYGKDPNLKREDVEALQEWLKKQPHLPEITELQLILALHSCYYRMEQAKLVIDNYFTVRTLCPDIFDCAEEDVLSRTLSVGFTMILPKQTPEGYDVITMKLIDYRPKNYNCLNLIKLTNMVSTLHFHQHGTANGLVIVFDMKGSSLALLAKINLTAIKQFLYHVQEGAPVRIKGVHIINVDSLTDKIIGMVKPFMKKELVNMMKFHSKSIVTLYDYVPKECLPKDYGGELSSTEILQEENTKNLFDNLDFFKWHDTQKVDETKRLGQRKDVNSMFGVEGTFKKLELD